MNTPQVWSNHNSHMGISLKPVKKQVVVNFGNTESGHISPDSLVINPTEAVKICKDKLLSKQRMKALRIPSPQFGMTVNKKTHLPIVVKLKQHSGGRGMERIRTKAELKDFIKRHGKAKNFYYERYIPFDREFRVHVSRYLRGEIFATEKVLRSYCNGVWVKNLRSCTFEEQFKKPKKWGQMVQQCVRFLDAIGMDLAGFDVGYVARSKKYYIIEGNSAVGMGDKTRAAYVAELNRICSIIGN